MGIFTSSLSPQLNAVKPVSGTEDYMGASMEEFRLHFTFIKLLKVVSHFQPNLGRGDLFPAQVSLVGYNQNIKNVLDKRQVLIIACVISKN